MKMKAADITAYPVFAYYVRVNMPQVQNVNKVIVGIKKFAGLTTRQTIEEGKNFEKAAYGKDINRYW